MPVLDQIIERSKRFLSGLRTETVAEGRMHGQGLDYLKDLLGRLDITEKSGQFTTVINNARNDCSREPFPKMPLSDHEIDDQIRFLLDYDRDKAIENNGERVVCSSGFSHKRKSGIDNVDFYFWTGQIIGTEHLSRYYKISLKGVYRFN